MYLLDFLTKSSCFSLLITFIFSLFNIGSSTKPIYFYISDTKVINTIVFSVIFIAFILSALLIMLYLNKSNISIYKIGMLIIVINFMLDIVFGGNQIFFINYTITFILLIINSIVKKKANN